MSGAKLKPSVLLSVKPDIPDMQAVPFPEATLVFGPPAGMEETQIATIHAYGRQVLGGSCDGCTQIITAWKPNELDLKRLNEGGLVYFSSIGGLPPHFLTTSFVESLNVA